MVGVGRGYFGYARRICMLLARAMADVYWWEQNPYLSSVHFKLDSDCSREEKIYPRAKRKRCEAHIPVCGIAWSGKHGGLHSLRKPTKSCGFGLERSCMAGRPDGASLYENTVHRITGGDMETMPAE